MGLYGESSQDALGHQRRVAAARARILTEELLTASAVSQALGSRSKNERQYANRPRRKGEIIGIPVRRNQFMYPAFQFDLERRRVHPEAAAVNRLLGTLEDPWGVAGWWVTPGSRLGARAPKDLLGTPESAKVVVAAEALLDE